MADKQRGLFDHITEIVQRQDPNYFDTLNVKEKRDFNGYMINRFLSMEPDWIEIVNYVQQFSPAMEPECLYKLYINVIPKSRKFLRYVKKSKKDTHDNWLIELISRHFEVSERDAEVYIDIFMHTKNGKFELREILESYGTDSKQIKKLKI